MKQRILKRMREQELKTLQVLAKLYHFFEQENDVDAQKKMRKLIEKGIEGEVQIAFCGHFSAGKSSLINYMMGESILPTSPIPTSANVVKLKQGSDEVTLSFLDGTQVVYEGEYHVEQVKAFCKNGEEIASITISSKQIQLPDGCALLDTPGIDSTEDAHRLFTESTLHLADMILYVVDYNHVQSQENFLFLKDLQTVGKSVYFIVNQMDKHDENEITFQDFQKSLEAAFLKWGISVEAIFYTSLVDETLFDNQVQSLKTLIHKRLADAHRDLSGTLMQGAYQLIDNHVQKLHEQNHENWQKIEDMKQTYTEADLETYHALQTEVQALRNRPAQFEKDASHSFEQLQKNTYLLTAETRELVRLFLESEQADFKVGFLFSRAKTDAVCAERRQALYEALLTRKKTQLDWHLKNWAEQYVKVYEVEAKEIIAMAGALEAEISMEWLQTEVAAQSEITGAYVLNFSEKITQYVLKQAKKAANNWLDCMREHLIEVGELSCELLMQKLADYAALHEALQLEEKLLQEKKNRRVQCEQILLNPNQSLSEQAWQDFLQTFTTEKNLHRMKKTFIQTEENTSTDVNGKGEREQLTISAQEKTNKQPKDREGMLQRLSNIISILNAYELPDGYLSEILEKQKNRLLNQTYTIALFGAFSAGKSSFANALLGKDLLPVSPNPTTAVINRVEASTADCPNESARIFLKSRDVLLEELQPILRKWKLTAQTIEEAFQKAQEWLTTAPVIEKEDYAYFSFIHAFCEGFKDFQNELGANFLVTYEEYCSFAVEERKSCLVEEMILYYDCPFTEAGLVLVDTPGADSIHARHTQTSFRYIKDCDAMIYVTYYNHSFSRADQEFLIQLGRVKDAFTLDKMFFICNAIDLAHTIKELQMVLNYIKQQLESFGIRLPRLYPVSSREALKEKLGTSTFRHPFLQHSQFKQFQSVFDDFVAKDLVGLAVDASQALLQSTVEELAHWIELAQTGNQEREQKLVCLQEEEKRQIAWLADLRFTNEDEKVRREKEELCHYLIQRVFLRFTNFFTGSFNPSLLNQQANIKQALQEAMDNLLSCIAFDMEQELRALGLRLEKFVCGCIESVAIRVQEQFLQTNYPVHLEAFVFQQRELPSSEGMMTALTQLNFRKELAMFKTPKRFFEMNGRKQMEAALKDKIQRQCEIYLQVESEKHLSYYQVAMHEELAHLKKESENTLKQAYQAITIILQKPLDLESMKVCYAKISEEMEEVQYVC